MRVVGIYSFKKSLSIVKSHRFSERDVGVSSFNLYSGYLVYMYSFWPL